MFIKHASKLFFLTSCTALLTACGSGSTVSSNANTSNSAAHTREVGWASPAMILQDGEESKTIELTSCNSGLQTASLVVTAAGDMVFRGAPMGSTTVSELHRINYSEATVKQVEGQNDLQGIQFSFVLESQNDFMSASTFNKAGRFHSSVASRSPTAYSCLLVNGTQAFTVSVLPSSQRVANKLSSDIYGITLPNGTTGTFSAGFVTWDNLDETGGTLPPDLQPYRYFQLDLTSGALLSSASATSPFSSALTIGFPLSATSSFARFEEKIEQGVKSLEIEADRPGVSIPLKIYIERIGNTLSPYAAWYFN